MHDLWPENAEAWAIFHQLAGRFLVDAALGAVVFDRLTQGWTAEEMAEMTERLGIVYDVLMPPKQS